MHRTFSGNFDELLDYGRIDPAFDANHTLEAINLADAALGSFTAILAVLGRPLAMPDADSETAKSELLVLGIEPQRH